MALYDQQHSFAGRPVNRAPGRCRRGGRDGTQDEAQCACCHRLLCIPDGCRVRNVLAGGSRPAAQRNHGAVGFDANLRRRGGVPALFPFPILAGALQGTLSRRPRSTWRRQDLSAAPAEADAGKPSALRAGRERDLVAILQERTRFAGRKRQRLLAAARDLEQRAEAFGAWRRDGAGAEQVAGLEIAAAQVWCATICAGVQ